MTHVPALVSSGNHHHGASETAIYVVSGNPVFVFLDVDGDEHAERRIQTGPGTTSSCRRSSRTARRIRRAFSAAKDEH